MEKIQKTNMSEKRNKKAKNTWKNTLINIKKLVSKYVRRRHTKRENTKKSSHQNMCEEGK